MLPVKKLEFNRSATKRLITRIETSIGEDHSIPVKKLVLYELIDFINSGVECKENIINSYPRQRSQEYLMSVLTLIRCGLKKKYGNFLKILFVIGS
ncbi:putative TPR domain protein, component of TonB system [Vibrio chagasii]|nr:putative TPR domain protein, component of TonB system [Vibrio chagasii]